MSEGKKRVPLRPGAFVVPEDPAESPYLEAQKCGDCGTYFPGHRVICLNCGAENMSTARLSGKGKVYSYTIARQQLPGAVVKVPYGVAIVILEEGCQIHAPVTEGYDDLAVDQDVEVYFEVVGQDEEGNDQLAYKVKAV